jgi:hypothetical protein
LTPLDQHPNPAHRTPYLLGQFMFRRSPAKTRAQDIARLPQAMQLVLYPQWKTDHARLARQGSSYGLLYPPPGIRRKANPPPMVIPLDGFHQPDVALLYQVPNKQSAVLKALRQADDKTQVAFDQTLACLLAALHGYSQLLLPTGIATRHLGELLFRCPSSLVLDGQLDLFFGAEQRIAPYLCQVDVHRSGRRRVFACRRHQGPPAFGIVYLIDVC